MWLVIFPEGTRYNLDKPDVIKESQQFAADKGGFNKYISCCLFNFYLSTYHQDID